MTKLLLEFDIPDCHFIIANTAAEAAGALKRNLKADIIITDWPTDEYCNGTTDAETKAVCALIWEQYLAVESQRRVILVFSSPTEEQVRGQLNAHPHPPTQLRSPITHFVPKYKRVLGKDGELVPPLKRLVELCVDEHKALKKKASAGAKRA